jgi:hypothetical protein
MEYHKDFYRFMPNPRQKTLFIGKNPLKDRFDEEFFTSIPTGPGIYKMFDEQGTLLYVGKSVNLRSRIRSYTCINSNNANYKLNQLVNLVHNISWAKTENETEALLQENSIIRELQPVYNQAKKNFQRYSFLAISTTDPGIMNFRILEVDPDLFDQFIYGAFKSRRSILGVLYKFQWFFKFFDDPSKITSLNPEAAASYYSKLEYTLYLPLNTAYPVRMWNSWINSYFKGTLSTVLSRIKECVSTEHDIDSFGWMIIEKQLDALQYQYDFGPHRNRRIIRQQELDSNIIPQEKLDDYIVLLKDN